MSAGATSHNRRRLAGLAARVGRGALCAAVVAVTMGVLLVLARTYDVPPLGVLFLVTTSLVMVAALIAITTRAHDRTDEKRRRAEADRSRAFEQLERNQQKLELALSAAKMATWEWDLTTGLIERSPEFDKIHGFEQRRKTWEAKWAFSLVPPEDREWLEAAVFEFVLGAKDFSIEHRVVWPDGSVHWVLLAGKARTEGGKVAALYGVLWDITDRKQAELSLEKERLELEQHVSALNETQSKLERAVAVRDEFLSIAAHELRTPLTALKLQIDGLRRFTPTEAGDGSSVRFRKKVEGAIRQTNRMTRLVEGLLSVSQMAMDRLRLDLEDLDMAELVRDTLESAGDESTRSRLVLSAPQALPGRWDRLNVEQALLNLVSNALKYGAGKPIDVRVQGAEERVEIIVSDRGIGIAEEDLGRIFDRFERAVPSRHYGGLGLGLYITRQIVRTHGGTISVTSTPGEGSTFVVSLPRISESLLDSPVLAQSRV